MKLAAVSSKSIIGNVQQNLETTISWIEKLSKKGADFILFPELNLSGYTKNSTILNDVLKQKDAVFKELLNISGQNNSAFAVGFPEKSGEKYYISHFLFHKGKIVGAHQKTHLGSTEKEIFIEGNIIKVFQVGELRIGIQLCYETHFPEISYVQEKQGANMLAMAFASPKESSEKKLERFMRFLPARAYDNACFVMACNLNGETENGLGFSPLALIVNPKGKVLDETLLGSSIALADLEQIHKIRLSRMAYFNKEKRTLLFQKYYSKDELNISEEKKL